MSGRARVGLLFDFPEEQWPSMDLTGEAVLGELQRRYAGELEVERVCPAFRQRFTKLPVVGGKGGARNADRLLNRMVDYPRAVRGIVREGRFDLFHLMDHSYSQLLHEIPSERSVVTCHDLDTFRAVLEPERDRRPAWFQRMVARILAGFRKAGAVVCVSEATRQEVLTHGLVEGKRVHLAPLGIGAEYFEAADGEADREVERWLGGAGQGLDPLLLFVGSGIPRKRLDVLVEVFAGVRRSEPGARLVKVGGKLPEAAARRIRELGLADAVITPPYLSNRQLAAMYRRVTLVLQTSEAEGFGLPVAEALACGASVLASDLPVLREVGGEAALYRRVADVPSWVEAALAMIADRRDFRETWRRRRQIGLARSRKYSWPSHVDRLAEIYRELLDRACL